MNLFIFIGQKSNERLLFLKLKIKITQVISMKKDDWERPKMKGNFLLKQTAAPLLLFVFINFDFARTNQL